MAPTDLVLRDASHLPAAPRATSAAAAYLAGLALGSRHAQRWALETLARWASSGRMKIDALPWGGLRYEHTAALRARAMTEYAPATANRMMTALRGTLHAAYQMNQISHEEYAKAIDLKRVEGSAVIMGRYLENAEINAFYAAAKASKMALRNLAVLALVADGALRRIEVVRATLDKYDPKAPSINVCGKRNKWRIVPLTATAKTALDAWIEVRGSWEGALICGYSRHGTIHHKPITTAGVSLIIDELRIAAGIVLPVTPHDFRRTYISDALDAEKADVISIAKVVGHDDPKTTLKYDRRTERAKMKVAASIPARKF